MLEKSVALFFLAGLCEIGGGYLVWQWWRNGAAWFLGLLGAGRMRHHHVQLTITCQLQGLPGALDDRLRIIVVLFLKPLDKRIK